MNVCNVHVCVRVCMCVYGCVFCTRLCVYMCVQYACLCGCVSVCVYAHRYSFQMNHRKLGHCRKNGGTSSIGKNSKGTQDRDSESSLDLPARPLQPRPGLLWQGHSSRFYSESSDCGESVAGELVCQVDGHGWTKMDILGSEQCLYRKVWFFLKMSEEVIFSGLSLRGRRSVNIQEKEPGWQWERCGKVLIMFPYRKSWDSHVYIQFQALFITSQVPLDSHPHTDHDICYSHSSLGPWCFEKLRGGL